jgi:hypothetical protein
LTWFVLGLGVAVTVAIYFRLGPSAALSSSIGVAVALANWYLLRVIVGRAVRGEVRGVARFSVVLLTKMVGLLGLIFVLLRSGWVQPLAFTVGLSSLALGTLLGSFVHVLTANAVENES